MPVSVLQSSGLVPDEGVTRRVLDDLDLEPEALGPFVQTAVASIASYDAEHGVDETDSTQELVTSSDVRHIRRSDKHPHEQSQRVNDHVAFAASDLLACVVADLLCRSSIWDALRVQDGGAGAGVVAALGSSKVRETTLDRVPGPVLAPRHKPFMNRGTRRELVGKHPPLTPGARLIQDRVHNITPIMTQRPPH